MLDMPKPKQPPLVKSPDMLAPPPQISADSNLDRMLHAWQSRYTGGRSPSTLALAFLDWAAHAANAPFQTAALGERALAKWRRLAQAATGGEKAIAPKPGDHRFAHPAWSKPPYDLLVQSVLLAEEWYRDVVDSPGGVGDANQRIVAFSVRQWLDLISPSNMPWLNPEVIEATSRRGGANLAAGLRNFLRDQAVPEGGSVPKDFVLGVDLAATPGKVVFRNALIELIQYAPTTADGRRRAGADRAGMDHEILYPRPFARQFADPLAGRPGTHRIRDLLAQSRRRHARYFAR